MRLALSWRREARLSEAAAPLEGAMFEWSGGRVSLNHDGFLQTPQQWSEPLACALARAFEGIEVMGDEHWAVVRFLRAHFVAHGRAPLVRALCQGTGLTLKRVYSLFPSGLARGACRVAGLPKADGCA